MFFRNISQCSLSIALGHLYIPHLKIYLRKLSVKISLRKRTYWLAPLIIQNSIDLSQYPQFLNTLLQLAHPPLFLVFFAHLFDLNSIEVKTSGRTMHLQHVSNVEYGIQILEEGVIYYLYLHPEVVAQRMQNPPALHFWRV